MNGLLRRIAIPTLLLTCVAIEWSRGGDSLPNWLANLSVKTGAGSDKALRILILLNCAAPCLHFCRLDCHAVLLG